MIKKQKGFHPLWYYDEQNKSTVWVHCDIENADDTYEYNGVLYHGKWIEGYYAPVFISEGTVPKVKFAMIADNCIAKPMYVGGNAFGCGGIPASYYVFEESVSYIDTNA